ncbi:MAG: pyridoxamine 5'-phosphate oxidase family protein [Nanoarchaeota archaeon]
MDKKEAERISSSIINILKRNYLLTLSTSKNNKPYSNTAFYAFDKNMGLYIWSEEESVHSENLKKNKRVAINIFDSRQKLGSLLQGLQATGTANIVDRRELINAGMLYIKRFPKTMKLVKNPNDFHSKLFESRIYKINLEEIKVFDEKTFGKGGSRKISLKWKQT